MFIAANKEAAAPKIIAALMAMIISEHYDDSSFPTAVQWSCSVGERSSARLCSEAEPAVIPGVVLR
jgi:hypothetical protein